MKFILFLLTALTRADISCITCEVGLLITPSATEVLKGDARCAQDDTANMVDLVKAYGDNKMCQMSYERQSFDNGTSIVYYDRSGQYKDPTKQYPIMWSGTETSSDCAGNYCNGQSGAEFFKQHPSPTTIPTITSGSSTTCYTCTAISHSGDMSELEPCLTPSPSTVADMGGCERCVQIFEVEPQPGHLRVRRACTDTHRDTNTVTSHFHFCVEDVCNSLIVSSGLLFNISISILLSLICL